MFSQLWKRITGKDEEAASLHRAAAAPTGVESAEVPTAPAGEVHSAPMTALSSTPGATEASLRRSLDWRANVLMSGANAEALASDGPAIVDLIRNGTETAIRQPPAAAQRALAVSRNPVSSIGDLTRLFEHDPTLTQALLQQANSVWYRRDGAAVVAIQEAIQRIGMQGVQNVLMQHMVQGLLCRPGGAYEAKVQQIWQHMSRTAPIARAIARAFGVDSESAFVLGLLHDVGKLVVFDRISTLRAERKRELRIPETFFKQMLWHLHEPVGGLAALRWGMGGEAAFAIAEHHRRNPEAQRESITQVIFLAEKLDLAKSGYGKLDWEAWRKEGALEVDIALVESLLADRAG